MGRKVFLRINLFCVKNCGFGKNAFCEHVDRLFKWTYFDHISGCDFNLSITKNVWVDAIKKILNNDFFKIASNDLDQILLLIMNQTKIYWS